jgi:hypothetical protein
MELKQVIARQWDTSIQDREMLREETIYVQDVCQTCGKVIKRPSGTPRAKPTQVQYRIDLPSPTLIIVTGANGDEVLKPFARQPRIHRLASLSQTFDRVWPSRKFIPASTTV